MKVNGLGTTVLAKVVIISTTLLLSGNHRSSCNEHIYKLVSRSNSIEPSRVSGYTSTDDPGREEYSKSGVVATNLTHTIDSLDLPAILSATTETPGRFRQGPITGSLRRNARAKGKSCPNRFRKPNNSRNIPVFVYPNRTSRIPP